MNPLCVVPQKKNNRLILMRSPEYFFFTFLRLLSPSARACVCACVREHKCVSDRERGERESVCVRACMCGHVLYEKGEKESVC